MKAFAKLQVRRSTWALLAGILALALLVGMSLLLSGSRSLAEPAAVAGVQKTVNADQAGPGDVLTYTVVISNAGVGVDVWVTDTLPVELDYVNGSLEWFGPGSAGAAGDVISWTASGFGWGQQVVLTFSAQISTAVAYATVINTAQFTGTGALLSDSAVTNVSPGELSAAKAVQPTSARPGEQLVYTIYITNTGGTVVDTAWMTDDLPVEVDYAGGLFASTGSAGVAGDVVTWTLTSPLAPSEAVYVTFAVEIDGALSEATTFTNTAVITGVGTTLLPSVEADVVTSLQYYLPYVLKNFPPMVVLHPIPIPGANNSYIVSWDPVSSTIQYVLQESTSPDFSTVVEWQTTNTSRSFQKGTAIGTYYYRVRADGPWGAGAWSNVESVAVGFFDNFSNTGSGWPTVQKLVIPETSTHYRTRYENDQYRIMIDPGGPLIWFYQPDALAPYRPQVDKYCVEVDVKIEKQKPPYDGGWNFFPYWANGGLIFGANEANTNLYGLCLAVGAMQGSDSADLGWYVVNNPSYNYPRDGCKAPGAVGGDSLGLNIKQWQHFQVGVDDNNVTVYINGVYKGTWNMPGLKSMTRVGVIAGDYEITPVDFRFDNFKVIPNYGCTP